MSRRRPTSAPINSSVASTPPPARKRAHTTHQLAPITPSVATDASASALLAELRSAASERARPAVSAGAAPIRIMARMVAELEATCREHGLAAAEIATGVINRTIGDVDLRRVSATEDPPDALTLADDLGLALPGEVIAGRIATGERYQWLRERMLSYERTLLDRRIDLRMYDLTALGNPLLRDMLSAYATREWGYAPPPAQLYLSMGALDGLSKLFLGFVASQRRLGVTENAVLFPAPSFGTPSWQISAVGMRLHTLRTRPEDRFGLTPTLLRETLAAHPDIRLVYLTIANNPTAFAYTPDELRALCHILLERDDLALVADLAYIGTGDPNQDRARMAVLREPGIYERVIFVSSFSKTHTLTGDRFGWVGFGDPALAERVAPGWSNTVASMPADWQLRYMAVIELLTEHPELEMRIRALYAHRRARLVRQLQRLDAQHQLFAQVNLDDGGTVYNWSQFRPGEDVFSLFGKTGIAGVPGGAFGYTDDYVRLSIGCVPVPDSDA